MLMIQEIELLASLLARAGMTPIEILFANSVMDRIRVMVAKETVEEKEKPNA